MSASIAVCEVTKTYAEGRATTRALESVSLEVHAGEMVLLMGPSGSGKTTLLSIMGCILKPTSGSVSIAGSEVSNWPEKGLSGVRLKHIGFVFQSFNLFPNLTAAENVAVALDLIGIRGAEARRRSRSLLDRIGLSDKYEVFPAELSGGQKQRVAIARSIAGEPTIILADEPTGSLGQTSGRMVMEMLHELAHQQGRAVVIVTHDRRMTDFADRTVSIEDGRIVSDSREEQ